MEAWWRRPIPSTDSAATDGTADTNDTAATSIDSMSSQAAEQGPSPVFSSVEVPADHGSSGSNQILPIRGVAGPSNGREPGVAANCGRKRRAMSDETQGQQPSQRPRRSSRLTGQARASCQIRR